MHRHACRLFWGTSASSATAAAKLTRGTETVRGAPPAKGIHKGWAGGEGEGSGEQPPYLSGEDDPEAWPRFIADYYIAKSASHETLGRQCARMELWESVAACDRRDGA